jgi:hypothetical protein
VLEENETGDSPQKRPRLSLCSICLRFQKSGSPIQYFVGDLRRRLATPPAEEIHQLPPQVFVLLARTISIRIQPLHQPVESGLVQV